MMTSFPPHTHGPDTVPTPAQHRRQTVPERPRPPKRQAMPPGVYVRLPARALEHAKAAALTADLSLAAWVRHLVTVEIGRPGAARPTRPRLPPPAEHVQALVGLQEKVGELGLAAQALASGLHERPGAPYQQELDDLLAELRSVSQALVHRVLRSTRRKDAAHEEATANRDKGAVP